MLRACLPTLGAALLGVCLVWSLSESPSPVVPAARPPALLDASCKPQGPVDVALLELGRAGPQLDLEWTVRPQRDLLALEWELLLPLDAMLLDGERRGTAPVIRGVETRQVVRVVVPDDARFRRASLVVRAVLQGHDEHGEVFEEPFEVVKHLSWGEPPLPGASVVSRDAETGALIPFVALPTAHREGR